MPDFHLRANMTTFPQRVSSTRRSISVFDSWCRSISRRIISSSSSLSALSILVLVFFISVYLRILVNLVRNRCGFSFSCQFVEFSTFNLARICCRIVQNGNTQTRLGTSVASRLLQLISSHFRSRASALHWFELSRPPFLSHRLKEYFVFHFFSSHLGWPFYAVGLDARLCSRQAKLK